MLDRYRQQLVDLSGKWQVGRRALSFEALLPLPGVVDDASGEAVDAAADWPVDRTHAEGRVGEPGRMRSDEGRAMAADLTANCRAAAASLDRSSAARRWWSKTTATGSSTGSKRTWPNWTSRSTRPT